ncbi:hypothetical protein UPYG_G00207790 [Umbra pygmaea]|uniref:Uncharacterized protein n=1 Tax=Umbra pygmaea TaxID=75934 RepID=A0ABD0X1F4_UMBPY
MRCQLLFRIPVENSSLPQAAVTELSPITGSATLVTFSLQPFPSPHTHLSRHSKYMPCPVKESSLYCE